MTNSPADKLDEMLRLLPDALLRLSERGRIVAHLGGGEDDELLNPAGLVGRSLDEALPAEVAGRIRQQIRRCLKTREEAAVDFSLGPRGREADYECRLIVAGRTSVLAILRRLRAGRGAARAAEPGDGVHYDDYVGRLEAALCEARLRERGLALVSVGFPQVPAIRRVLGRSVSEAVLSVAGTRIDNCLRDGDLRQSPGADRDPAPAQIAGSGEFALVLRDVEEREAAAQVAARIQRAFEEPVSLDEHRFELTPKLGIAFFPIDGDSGEELLQNARKALDEALLRGSTPQQFYTDTTRFRVRRRLDTHNELRWAVENGQLELRYLPRIDLGSGRVAGLEALLRWAHPLRGLIDLAEVIPIAEASGLMTAIGEWVLGAACSQSAAWREHWRSLPPIGINLSEQEFARDDLVLVVESALASAGLPAAALEFEITESMLMREARAAAQVRRLHKLGVGIVIDDFGRGYSSVARMTELPIDAIKIDRPIVDGCRDGGTGGAACAALIAMASRLGLTVIAEGVETLDQIDFLRAQGCDALQGFFFTEPLAAAEVPGFLAAHLGETPGGEPQELETIRTRFLLQPQD